MDKLLLPTLIIVGMSILLLSVGVFGACLAVLARGAAHALSSQSLVAAHVCIDEFAFDEDTHREEEDGHSNNN